MAEGVSNFGVLRTVPKDCLINGLVADSKRRVCNNLRPNLSSISRFGEVAEVEDAKELKVSIPLDVLDRNFRNDLEKHKIANSAREFAEFDRKLGLEARVTELGIKLDDILDRLRVLTGLVLKNNSNERI